MDLGLLCGSDQEIGYAHAGAEHFFHDGIVLLLRQTDGKCLVFLVVRKLAPYYTRAKTGFDTPLFNTFYSVKKKQKHRAQRKNGAVSILHLRAA